MKAHSPKIHLGLLGGSGRMGREVTTLVDSEMREVFTISASPGRGENILGLSDCDVVIDFAFPEVCASLVDAWLKTPRERSMPALVVGSTGWSEEAERKLLQLAARTPVLKATNFSVGVLVTARIVREFGPLLQDFGYTPVLVETHHQHKKDAPSGTALTLRAAINPNHPEGIQTHSIRAGEVIGDHEITFFGPSDRITVGHCAQNRSLFARGALEAARWLAALKAGGASGRILTLEDWFSARQPSG